MAPQPSFGPLAARLAAKADEIRPAEGAEVSWANFIALFFCAIFQMLILLCETLDARAALVASSVAAPASRDGRPLRAPAERGAMRAVVRAPARPVDVQALAPERDAAPAGTIGPRPAGPWLAWSRPPGPPRPMAVPKVGFSRRRSGFQAGVRHAYIVTVS